MNVFICRLPGKERSKNSFFPGLEEDKFLPISIQKGTDDNLLKLDLFHGALQCSDVIFFQFVFAQPFCLFLFDKVIKGKFIEID